MPFLLTWFERQIFLKRHWGPGPILDMFAPLAFKALHTAHKLGVFHIIEACPQTSVELARKIPADEYSVRTLLDTLCAIGYMRKKAALYCTTDMTRRWVTADPSAGLATMFGFFDDAFERWDNLDQTIRTGAPVEKDGRWFDNHPGSWERYHAGMRGIAGLMAGEIVKSVRLPANAARIIDIGGSHGLYSIRFCQRYAGLSAVIVDLPQARPIAESTIAEHALGGRVSFVEGDILKNELAGNFDAALLINTIRVFPRAAGATILQKAYRALKPGGVIAIADQFNSSRGTPFAQANALLIVLELINSGAGSIYTASEVMAMLREAGFTNPREIRLRRSPGISVVTAIKPGVSPN
jgi:ubiquinone/menaquinone biosynthesis C-methylase UbiE